MLTLIKRGLGIIIVRTCCTFAVINLPIRAKIGFTNALTRLMLATANSHEVINVHFNVGTGKIEFDL